LFNLYEENVLNLKHADKVVLLSNEYDRLLFLYFCYRYLASGDSLQTIAFSYRIGHSTALYIVRETCQVIWNILQSEVLKLPGTREWLAISDEFWNFPNCVGALDGKHVQIQAPARCGSQYFNYKGSHSIVLLAVVDSNLRFVVVDIGQYGRCSDGGVFAASNFGDAFLRGRLELPADAPFPHSSANSPPIPYVFVADEAFPLKSNLLKPYAGRTCTQEKTIFNYRLSRARRTVENAFGLLAHRWRIYRRAIQANPDSVVDYVKATVVLHNFLGDTNMDESAVDAACLQAFSAAKCNNSSRSSQAVRDAFCNFCQTPEGAVPWQIGVVNCGLSWTTLLLTVSNYIFSILLCSY
jgi:hypothetical protein